MRRLVALFAKLAGLPDGAGAGIRLRAGAAPAIAVPLFKGATIMVRPATSIEVAIAGSRAARFLAGLIVAADAGEMAAAVLGEEFRPADINDQVWRVEMANRFSLLELAVLCIPAWSKVRGTDGVLVDKPTREAIALLLQDPESKTRIETVINARVYEEYAEGNEWPASPSGGAGIPVTAGDAATPAQPAPAATAASPARAVPK